MNQIVELAFPVEDGGDLPEYWRESHKAAQADIEAGRLTYFDDEEDFDRALDAASGSPGSAGFPSVLDNHGLPRP